MLIAGVIDKDYRGNVGVVMFNFSKTDYQGTLSVTQRATIINIIIISM